jgi:hypothetical protein
MPPRRDANRDLLAIAFLLAKMDGDIGSPLHAIHIARDVPIVRSGSNKFLYS